MRLCGGFLGFMTTFMTKVKVTPSLNKMQRAHFRTKHRILSNYRTELRKSLDMTGDIPTADSKRYVVITRHSMGTLDNDNFIGGCKQLVDALQREGLIKDDSPEWVQIDYKQEKAKRGEGFTAVRVMI